MRDKGYPRPPAAPSPLARAPVSALAHLALPSDLLKATLRERGHRGWAAVAPELEPYLDADRWPSGAPMLADIATHLRRRTRMAPWVPHTTYLLLAVPISTVVSTILCAVFCHEILSSALTARWPALRDHPMCDRPNAPPPEPGESGNDINLVCMPCIKFAAVFVTVLTLLLYGIFRLNRQVEQHVNCLYLMYALARSTPSMPHEAIHHFRVQQGSLAQTRTEVTVFADGEYQLRRITAHSPTVSSEFSTDDGHTTLETVVGNVHCMRVREDMEPLLEDSCV